MFLPILALALGPSAKEGLDTYNRLDAHEALLPGSDGWVTYADARIRLVGLAEATDLRADGGEPFTPPPKTKVWRVTLAFDAADKEAVIGCDLALEDTDGRRFTANPAEMSEADTRWVASCTPEDDNAPSPWEVEIYFVMPESAEPAAVRVTSGTQLPRYARLPAP